MGLRWQAHTAPAAPASATARAATRRLALASSAVLGLWVLGAVLMLPQRQVEPAPHPAAEARHASEAAAAPASAPALGDPVPSSAGEPIASPTEDARAHGLDALARTSLRGSEVDGELRLGADGRLLRDAGLVRFFEFHLALLGELDLAAIRRLVAAHASQRLGAEAVDSVLAAFDRYVAFRQALAALPPAARLQDTLAARRALERQWFDEAAEAMFGEARDYDARTLERLEAAARNPRTRDAWGALPAAEREARSAALAEEQTRQFDALALSAEQRRAERTALWGAQAAARLDALDAERAAWESRLAAYARERERLLAVGGTAPADVEALRQRWFDPRERLRIEALERAGAL